MVMLTVWQKFVLSAMRSKNPATFYLVNYVFSQYFFEQFYAVSSDDYFEKGLITISFDCDFDTDYSTMDNILDKLDLFDLKCSFAVIGKFIEKYPNIHKKILDRGHTLLNHTYTHPDNPLWNPDQHFHKLPFSKQKEEIERCHDICYQITRYEMTGYRAPHFGRQFTRNIYKILPELGYTYSSSIKSVRSIYQWKPYMERGGIIEFPLSTCPAHPLMTFDSYHLIRAGTHRNKNEFIKLFCKLIETVKNNNAYANFYFDPRDFSGENLSLLEDIAIKIRDSGLEHFNYKDILPIIFEKQTSKN